MNEPTFWVTFERDCDCVDWQGEPVNPEITGNGDESCIRCPQCWTEWIIEVCIEEPE